MNNKLPIFVTRIAVCIFSISMTMLAPLIVLIGADFGQGISGSGFLYTVYYVSNIFFCLVSGKIMSRFGTRRSMAAAVAVFALTTFLFTRVHIFFFACIFMTIMGALATFIEAVGMAIVGDLAQDAASSNLSVTHAFAGVGAFVGVTYSGLMISMGYSWRDIYGYFSIAVAVITVVFCLTPFPKMRAGEGGSLKELKELLKNRSFYPSYLSLFLYVGAEGGITGWLATYMTQSLGYSPLSASLFTGIIWICVTLGRMACSALVKRYPLRRIVVILDTICILSIFASVTSPGGPVLWLAVVGIGCGLSGMWPLIASSVMRDDESSGNVMSIVLLFGYFGSSVVPYLIGVVGEFAGMTAAILSTTVVFLLLGLTVQFLIPRSLLKDGRMRPARENN